MWEDQGRGGRRIEGEIGGRGREGTGDGEWLRRGATGQGGQYGVQRKETFPLLASAAVPPPSVELRVGLRKTAAPMGALPGP